MRDIRKELEALREKLRRMERSSPQAEPRRPEWNRDLPPWESATGDSLFEASLQPGAPQWRRGGIEECVTGKIVETSQGRHFQAETRYTFSMVHGSFEVHGLRDLPGTLITALCPEHEGGASPTWAFLDTETTGLAGGTGSFAFLIGLGMVTPDGFLVRQYFLREPAEEASVLEALARDLAGLQTLVTYNGRSFDAPLLETRYRLARARIPFADMPHLDLLFACRRLWKRRFESCKLTSLERDVLGFERVGDVPGFLIPSLYTNYLRTGEAGSLAPVFTHNALDILSLACLTSLVGSVFENPEAAPRRHPGECLGLGNWLLQVGRREEALRFLWRAANSAIAEDLLARTLWDIAITERQLGRYEEMRRPLEQLLGFPNRFQCQALEALSILFERRLPDTRRSLAYARQLVEREPDERNAARVERLVRRLQRTRRLIE